MTGFKTVALGTAPTPLAATWLARAHQSMPVESLAALPSVLARVPLEVLELPRQLLQDFRGIGVHTVGECLRLPRDSLARRFSPAVLTLLVLVVFGRRQLRDVPEGLSKVFDAQPSS